MPLHDPPLYGARAGKGNGDLYKAPSPGRRFPQGEPGRQGCKGNRAGAGFSVCTSPCSGRSQTGERRFPMRILHPLRQKMPPGGHSGGESLQNLEAGCGKMHRLRPLRRLLPQKMSENAVNPFAEHIHASKHPARGTPASGLPAGKFRKTGRSKRRSPGVQGCIVACLHLHTLALQKCSENRRLCEPFVLIKGAGCFCFLLVFCFFVFMGRGMPAKGLLSARATRAGILFPQAADSKGLKGFWNYST